MIDEQETEEYDLGADLFGDLPEDSEDVEVPVLYDDDDDDDELPPAEDKKEEPDQEGKPEEAEEDISVRLERAEKRVKDNQANFQKEHQERLRIQAELEQLRNSSQGVEPEGQDNEIDEDAFYDDPVAALKKIREEQKRAIQNLQDAQSFRELERAEEVARKTYDDYDTVIDGFLVPEMTKNPSIRAEWLSKGGDPETAYQMGKQMIAYRDYTSDPDGFKNRLREELKQEMEGKKPTIGRTLSNTPSARGVVKNQEDDDLLSDL